jgi:excisionase family DNA binding protein
MFVNDLRKRGLCVPGKASFGVAELARILDVTKQTVYLWIREDRLVAHGRPARIKREDVVEFISNGFGR